MAVSETMPSVYFIIGVVVEKITLPCTSLLADCTFNGINI